MTLCATTSVSLDWSIHGFCICVFSSFLIAALVNFNTFYCIRVSGPFRVSMRDTPFCAVAAARIIMVNVFHWVTEDFSAISRSVCCVPKVRASLFCLRSFKLRVRTPKGVLPHIFQSSESSSPPIPSPLLRTDSDVVYANVEGAILDFPPPHPSPTPVSGIRN